MNIPMLSIWILMIVIGTVIVIGMRIIPERFLLKLKGKISPNQMSISSVPPTWLGTYLIISDVERGTMGISAVVGVFLIFTFRGVDILDGRLGRILQKYFNIPDPKIFWASLSHPGICEWGEILDPLMDKLSAIPMFIYVLYKYYKTLFRNGIASGMDTVIFIGALLITISILADITGTIIRMDYFKKKGIIKGKGSTWAGKFKTVAQWFWLILYFVPEFGWIPDYLFEYAIFLIVILTLVVTLGLISILTKMFHFKEHWTKSLKTT